MAGWESLSLIYLKEYRQRHEEGYDVRTMPNPTTLTALNAAEWAKLIDQLNACPKQVN